MNSWNFTGNTGKDAEVKALSNGETITSFSVAVKSGYLKNEVTSWVNCSIYGKRGEAVAQYIKKGVLIGVSGEGLLRTWDNKDGVKQSSLECRVNDVTLLGGKSDNATTRAKQDAPVKKCGGGGSGGFDDMDSDIPF